jgi:MoaA/NifB/PqqE/SkfB family radical SAM enzyme
MLKRLEEWIEYLLAPELDWIQVEVTTHCNASCTYCPHTVYKDSWIDRHISLSTYERLLPAFRQTRLVHLQGWGEPLLNPALFEMAALAKEAGCDVGITTNGTMLDATTAVRAVEIGLDIIAFSLAGTDEKNDIARKGTHLSEVLDAIEAVNREKKRAGTRKPSIHIAYMLMRSGIGDLDGLPGLLRGRGIDQVVITTLDFVPSPDMMREAIIPSDKAAHDELISHLERVVQSGKDAGLDIHYYLTHPGISNRVCTENPQRALFVSSDGTISPCVFTNLPVSEAKYVSNGEIRPYRALTFGNIKDYSLAGRWRRRDYSAFRASFTRGDPVEPCDRCYKLNMIRRREG